METSKNFRCAAIFGASGGIGGALARLLASEGSSVWAGSREGNVSGEKIRPFAFDLMNESSIREAARAMQANPPDLVIVATGALTLPDGTGPERRIASLDPDIMARAFQINTIGPAMIAKHMLPLFPREGRAVFAALSARVGSISDNQLGGWHSYRASKAALNMLIRNFAIEIGRTRPDAVVVALHPGTVATPLSAPFRANLADGQLTSSEDAACHLVTVVELLTPEDSGKHFDWRGKEVPA